MDVAKGTKMYCDGSPDFSVMQWLLILNSLRLLFFWANKIHQNRTRFIFFFISKYITKKEKNTYLLLVHSKLCYSLYYVNAYHSVHDPTLQKVTTRLQFFRVSAENADRIRVNCSAGQTPVTSFKINAFNNLTKDKKTGSGRPTNKRADKQQRLSNKPTRQGQKDLLFAAYFQVVILTKSWMFWSVLKQTLINDMYTSYSQLICVELLQFILFG